MNQRHFLPVCIVASMVGFLGLIPGCGDSNQCGECNGTGKVNIVDSWSGQAATLTCRKCSGKGELQAQRPMKRQRSWYIIPAVLAVGAVGRALFGKTKIGKDLFG